MTTLELSKDALRDLTDAQLEQLIGRLSEAEVMAHGGHVGDVRFSGSITAPDGGVDIRVDVKDGSFVYGFIPRANTIFQSKKSKMPAGKIKDEMKPKGVLLPVIGQQCERGGAYVIVSLGDDCADPVRIKRCQAMSTAIADHPNKDAIVDFYDRSKLHQWLRQHPSIMLWVRSVLGQPLSGWQPYGSWSNVPHGATDEFIMEPGVSVILPTQQDQQLTLQEFALKDAIAPTRKLISTTYKAIRVAGLSGVGKTRFVQALFDETIGENALDRTSVVYTDTGADPDPSARQMIDQLIQDGQAAIVVIDNCPSALHSDLAGRITSTKNRIKLITVEYDIRDDQPFKTEVVRIEANGPEIAEALVLRRYPGIGKANARRVAEFSGGNSRIALALADRVEAGESLAKLSDANLFERLFQQRHEADGQLLAHAKVLSLAYSFAVEVADGEPDEPDELEVLGAFCGATSTQLYISAQTLCERQVAQKRGRWRAILPQAIANRLAASALSGLPIKTICSTFENLINKRLLRSFAHRLGLMHDDPVAQEIVAAWLTEGGMLVPVTGLNDEMAEILDYVSPVRPDLLLDRIETEIMDPGFTVHQNARRTTVLNILVLLAYEPETFDRCIKLLLRIAEQEDPANSHGAVPDAIAQLFQAYLSGTHATMEQRAAHLRTSLWSQDQNLRAIGFKMLSSTLEGTSWMGSGMGDFGARPRDFGLKPNYDQFVAWCELFMGIALKAGLDDDADLSDRARKVFAKLFRGLWDHTAVRGRLIETALELNKQRAWTEGWKAVQETIHFDYRVLADNAVAKPIPQELAELRDTLAPQELLANIKIYLSEGSHDLYYLDPDFDHNDTEKHAQAEARISERVTGFGEQFSNANWRFEQLGTQLFSTNGRPYGKAFGMGLAKGSHDITGSWAAMVTALRESGLASFNCAVLSGFIEEAGRINPGVDRQILDGCLDDPLLRPSIRELHPAHDFTDADLDRCMSALAHPEVDAQSFGNLLWWQEFAALPAEKLLKLARMLLEKPNGDETVLDALSMKLYDKDKTIDTLGSDFRRIGLIAATNRLGRKGNGNTASIDGHMARVTAACLSHDGHDEKKTAWLDAVFLSIDADSGISPSYAQSIQVTAATLTEQFLDRVFGGDEQQRASRLRLLKRIVYLKPVFTSTDVGRIIAWCNSKDDPVIWEGVALAAPLFETTGDEKTVSVSEVSKRFLEASPFPEQVLISYAKQIAPNGWSGSPTGVMEKKANALAVFTKHQNPAIAIFVTQLIAQAETRIKTARDRERREDEAYEQRFE